MSIKLIYHTDTSINGGISPFDEAIHQISNNEELLIACPYIDISYVKPFLYKCNKWRIVSDVEAWLSAFQGKSREQIINFIVENKSQIHHFNNLHAKVILGNHLCLVGSANLTKMGITERVEMSILLDDNENFKEIQRWFENLWTESEEIDVTELENYVQEVTIIQSPSEKPSKSLTSKTPIIKAKIHNFDNKEDENTSEIPKPNNSDSLEKNYRDKDFNERFWNLIKEAEVLWSRRIDEYIKENGDQEFFATLGAGIYVFHLPFRHRVPKRKLILHAPPAAYGKALHCWDIAEEVVSFLQSKGVSCFYYPGTAD